MIIMGARQDFLESRELHEAQLEAVIRYKDDLIDYLERFLSELVLAMHRLGTRVEILAATLYTLGEPALRAGDGPGDCATRDAAQVMHSAFHRLHST